MYLCDELWVQRVVHLLCITGYVTVSVIVTVIVLYVMVGVLIHCDSESDSAV